MHNEGAGSEDALSPALRHLMASPAYKQLCRFQLEDPYPVLDELRECDPVHWSPELEAWVVTRFELVRECLARPRAGKRPHGHKHASYSRTSAAQLSFARGAHIELARVYGPA